MLFLNSLQIRRAYIDSNDTPATAMPLRKDTNISGPLPLNELLALSDRVHSKPIPGPQFQRTAPPSSGSSMAVNAPDRSFLTSNHLLHTFTALHLTIRSSLRAFIYTKLGNSVQTGTSLTWENYKQKRTPYTTSDIAFSSSSILNMSPTA